MILDRRKNELVQALLRARDRKDGGNLLDNVAQTRTAPGDGNYGDVAFGGIGFPPSRLDVTADNRAAGQSRKFISTTRPRPFNDPARFSYTGEIADLAKARGIPAHDQLAFKDSPSTLSGQVNPQTSYGRPLAVSGAAANQKGYLDYLWESLFPPYCSSPEDNPTFPPLIYQDKDKGEEQGEEQGKKKELTEEEKQACHDQYDHDLEQCDQNYGYSQEAKSRCRDRAMIIRDLCLRGEKETLPWKDPDEDGLKFKPPPKGRKKR